MKRSLSGCSAPTTTIDKHSKKKTRSTLPIFFILLLRLLLSPLSIQAEDRLVSDTIQLARQGDGEAQFSLGLMYDTGNLVERNPEQAVLWFKKAATAGVAGACLYLGMKYEFGAGVEQNSRKAEHWYEQAALRGWPQAAFLLAGLYLHAAKADLIRGCAWLAVAAEQEYPGAEESRQQSCAGMGDEQAEKSQKLRCQLLRKIYSKGEASASR